MSASTERKNRQAAREAGTDKKTLAQAREAEAKAKSRLRWTLGTIAVVLVVAAVLILNSGLMYRLPAFTVGSKSYNASEVSYRYSNQYYSFANQYGNYASLFGLDTSNGIQGLKKQECSMLENGGTWKDYFLNAAKEEMIHATVLGQYAAENNITLDEDDKATIDSAFEGIEEQAQSVGYLSADNMLAANYGTGVNQQLVRRAYEESQLASKAAQALTDSFTYTPEEIEAKYQSYEGTQDFYDYAYAYISAERVETTNDAGETSSDVTPETLAAAEEKANAIADAYNKPAEEKPAEEKPADEKEAAEQPVAEEPAELDPAERLIEAARSVDASAMRQTRVSGSSIPVSEWMRSAERKAGDITVEPDANGCYVVVFLSKDDNHYATANVRHILVMAEADADGNYTDEAKAAAKARAEEILAEFESGDKTEERFAELAEKYSEDVGSNTNGGLYENVAKGQMVPEFDAFCFGGHKPGDTGIVYGESGSYAGYHVMYFVGEGETYSNVIADSDLRNEAASAWIEEREAANPTKEGFGMKFVG